jgi:cysteinyl-tRNA synthetase
MKLYNSLSNSIEVFKPIKENEVSMYVCGPTVYNHAHIGNARPIVVFDTLQRTFEALGYQVKFVSNFTDVDDRIIQQAHDEHVDEVVISERYIDAYEKVRAGLHTKNPTTIKVTDTIDEIIDFVSELIEQGYAYEVDGDVYFRVDKIKEYGELSNQKMEDLMVGARIEENTKKENPLDFALWKKTDMGIKWQTPWGEGRPGWHTECVVMIHKEFKGEKIDIHGGGMDLKFPHHENEIAQSRALYQSQIANYWVHNGFLAFDNDEKMSKSLGNVQWAKDIIERYGSNVTRWLLLSAHYRAPLKFSEDVIVQAQSEVDKIFFALNQTYVKAQLAGKEVIDTSIKNEEYYVRFLDAMCDDLNTPNAYSEIFEAIKYLNQSLRQKEINWDGPLAVANAIIAMLDILGITYHLPLLTMDDFDLFTKWDQAKQEKDFSKADEYRTILMEKDLL